MSCICGYDGGEIDLLAFFVNKIGEISANAL
jgi:hypothetical protein